MRIAKTCGGKILFLVVLCLSVCALLPMASFSAKTPIARPIHLEGTATILDIMTVTPWTYFDQGVANEFGKYRGGCKFFTDTHAHCILFTANGDQVFLEVNGSTMIIKGGTGRFEGASGGWNSVITSESGSPDPWGGLTYTMTYEGEGTIIY